MTQDEVIERLQLLFDDVFLEKVEVTAELSAHDVDEWDSLTHITLVLAVESAFGIRFRIGEVEAAKNIGAFAELIRKRVHEAA